LIRIIKYIIYDLLRTRFILLYLFFLMASTIGMFQLDSDTSKVILSLMNIVLLVVPLVSLIFTTIHFYNSYEFIEMMLAQPINRKTVYLGEYIAVMISLILAFVIGLGLPMIIYGADSSGLTLIFSGVMLTMVFVSIAFLAAVATRDKAKAIGISLLFWFFFSLIYDAFLIWVVYAFNDYPLEKPILALISFNPIDMARILLLMQLDISALMGYTGAFYKNFFGSSMGFLFSTFVLILWVLIPTFMGWKLFSTKDL
jgi:Cu-processing system permease protein